MMLMLMFQKQKSEVFDLTSTYLFFSIAPRLHDDTRGKVGLRDCAAK